MAHQTGVGQSLQPSVLWLTPRSSCGVCPRSLQGAAPQHRTPGHRVLQVPALALVARDGLWQDPQPIWVW